MRSPALVVLSLLLVGCDGIVGELGQAEGIPTPPDPLAPALETFLCSPSTGYAPLTVQCRVKASDKEAQPVHCVVTIADGLPPVELADCTAERQVELTLPTVGEYTVRAQAVDSDGLVALRSQAFVVTERPNAAPVIADFTATPNSGTVPLATTLRWTASDADADAVSCEVDVGDDGTVEQTFTASACTAGSMQWAVTTAGSVPVKLRVKDTRGATAESSLTLTARMVTGEVTLSGVEWMQTIVKENLRLVANKPAVLRVYVTADRVGLQGVRLEGEAFRAGTSLGKLTFTGPATPPVTSPNTDLSQQYVADVPPAWIAPGLEVRLKADADDVVSESDELNNARTLNPAVGEPNVFEVTSVPVVHQGVTATTPAVEPTMLRLWPMSKVNTQVRAPYTYAGTLLATDGNTWNDLLGEIGSLRQADGSKRQYYGFVRVSFTSGIAGIGYIGQPAAIGRQDSLSTYAHEKGHNLGRPHAPCGGAAGPDPSYPYTSATLGSWGYDAANKRLINPASSYRDLMSYCDPEWVSDYNYGKVQNFMETQPDTIAGTAPDQLSLLVAGTLREGKWVLRPVQRLYARPTRPEDGPLAVRLRALDGREVQVPFRTWEVEPVADALPELHFSMIVPDVGDLAAIEIVSGNDILFRRSGVPQPGAVPQVERVDANSLRVTWNALTHPSAAVAFLGPDGRTTLALDLRGGDVLLRTDGLPEQGDFEVSVTDGLNPLRRVVAIR